LKKRENTGLSRKITAVHTNVFDKKNISVDLNFYVNVYNISKKNVKCIRWIIIKLKYEMK
jgi:hypothetical protein